MLIYLTIISSHSKVLLDSRHFGVSDCVPRVSVEATEEEAAWRTIAPVEVAVSQAICEIRREAHLSATHLMK